MKNGKILNTLKQLSIALPGSTLEYTKSNVPFVKYNDNRIVYFYRTSKYRIFYKDTHTDCETQSAVIDAVR